MKPVGAADPPAFMFEKVGTKSRCNLASEDALILEMIGELARKLSLVDAAVEKFHTELGPGQKAFGLLPCILVEAVNMLLRARETITIIAHQHRLRATLHPLPYPKYADTGVHTRKCVLCAQSSSFKYFSSIEVIGVRSVHKKGTTKL
jgi:glutamine synthetase